jgi:penicillin amidase
VAFSFRDAGIAIVDDFYRFFGPFLKSSISFWSKQRHPQVTGRVYAQGLNAPVQVRRDEWGIPSIKVSDRQDLFFAQGFLHAQDRLWQMEINRRSARGTLSAILGPLALETDRLTRTLGFSYLGEQAWIRTSEKVRTDVLAYTAGVNAYLENEFALPVEFSLLRHRPEPWDPVDIAAFARLMVWSLSHGWSGELTRARILEKVDNRTANELEPFYPEKNPLSLPHGIEFNQLKPDGMLQSASGPFLSRGLEGSGRGSNGWVISGRLSSSGHAILCNDVHLPVTTPSLWYYNRLNLQPNTSDISGFQVTGASVPGLPYVLLGHNDHIAWGATLSFVDCEDLFVEKFDPDRELHYQYQGEWIEADMRLEPIEIKGRQSHIERVITTRHGPLISKVLGGGEHALALQSTALQPNEGFDGFACLNEAKNWDEFVEAIQRIESPSLNLLYADVDDNIGYYVSGKVPIRAKGTGMVPYPGWSGEFDWIEYVPFEEMPHALNPKEGFLVTANNRIVDDSYPYFLGSLWINGYRARRITDMLGAELSISVEDCKRIQMDLTSIPGKQLVEALEDIQATDDDALLGLGLLRQWDGQLDADSVGGAVYQVFLANITREILEPILGRGLTDEYLGTGPHPVLIPITEFHGQWAPILIRALMNQDSSLWERTGGRQHSIQRSTASAVLELRSILGDDFSKWSWGRLHQITFDHVMAQRSPLDVVFSQGPFPIGGDINTVLQTATAQTDPSANTAVAPSYRQIIDLGDLNSGLAMYTPGQSGWLGSPNYSNMVASWLSGEYFPMTDRTSPSEPSPASQIALFPSI